MPKNFELIGPTFVGLWVRDLKVSVNFYEKKLGLRRDPEVFPQGAVAFLTRPIPFGLLPAPAGMELNPARPILAPSVWFKTANTQVVYQALVEDGITILREPSDGRFGQQFTFVDPDGYAITIYDRDAPANGWE